MGLTLGFGWIIHSFPCLRKKQKKRRKEKEGRKRTRKAETKRERGRKDGGRDRGSQAGWEKVRIPALAQTLRDPSSCLSASVPALMRSGTCSGLWWQPSEIDLITGFFTRLWTFFFKNLVPRTDTVGPLDHSCLKIKNLGEKKTKIFFKKTIFESLPNGEFFHTCLPQPFHRRVVWI